MFQFKKPRNELEFILKNGKKRTPSIPDEMFTYCPSCKKTLITDELSDNANVCSKCGYHFYIKARMRLHLIADKDSFTEVDRYMQSTNVIGFPDYEKKLKHAKLASSENEAVVTGLCSIAGVRCAVFVMEKNFMMGSMGTVVGEKITRLFETAIEKKLPVVGFTGYAGGARMQEVSISLMQIWQRQAGAVSKHSKSGLLYIAAYCGIGAEERGQGQAIAENLTEMMDLQTPIITILIGEGGSGGALALAVANEVWMLEKAVYSVISPEGCASILYKDPKLADRAAENLKLTAKDMLKFGVVDKVISESLPKSTFHIIRNELSTALSNSAPFRVKSSPLSAIIAIALVDNQDIYTLVRSLNYSTLHGCDRSVQPLRHHDHQYCEKQQIERVQSDIYFVSNNSKYGWHQGTTCIGTRHLYTNDRL